MEDAQLGNNLVSRALDLCNATASKVVRWTWPSANYSKLDAHAGPVADPCLGRDPSGNNSDEVVFEDVTGPILCDTSTITDICNTTDVEVELVSLIEEQIPRYHLRADTLTQFSGYENEDWYIHTPIVPPDADLDLSPELVDETLKYFILCGDRLSQMTKTYNDIDAVTRLLEEKERDLELAARIGQTLLEQNKDLRQRHELLEQELAIANETVEHLTSEIVAACDRVTQLRHELSLKNGLLQIYTQDIETDSDPGTPSRPFVTNWDAINQKIIRLEDENKQLRTEAVLCQADLEVEEKRESELINECIKQLSDANHQQSTIQEELAKKTDDNLRQQEEITQMLAQVVDLQRKNRCLSSENEQLQTKLHIVKECENELSEELIEVKEKYGELLAAFQELQDEYRRTRRSQLPNATAQWSYGMHSPYINPDSLASELESSFGRDSEGYASDERTSQSRRIFETVKCANGSRFVRQRRTGPRHSLTNSQKPCISSSTKFSSFGQLSSISSSLASDSESAYAESYHTDDESQYSSLSSVGRPGILGKSDNETVLTRLSSGVGKDSGRDDVSPGRCHSPDSICSGASERLVYLGVKHYHLPEKLQIVKPLEGSQTLHHWQRLAIPHLGAILEDRPGVEVKTGSQFQKDLRETYTLSDYEEEDADYVHPGKSFMDTSSVYTYTNSTILHPSDQTRVTPSYPTLQLATRITSQPPASTLNSPQQHRESSTSTFSTTLGLAKLLNERGLYAMVPTVTCSRDRIASPTPTPVPSPENSPPPTPPPFSPVNVPDLLGGSSAARCSHLLRSLSKKRRKTSRSSGDTPPVAIDRGQQTILSMNLLEKLSRLGVESVMSTGTQVPGASEATWSPRNCISTNNPPASAQTEVPTIHSNVSPRVSSSVAAETEKSEVPLAHPWGYVPAAKSPQVLGLSGSVGTPLSRMPNPILQLNSLRGLNVISEIGTVGAIRTLRKGGYI